MADQSFREQLRARIETYRAAERDAEIRLRDVQDEFERLHQRRVAAETVYEAEFGGGDARPRPAYERAIQTRLTDTAPGELTLDSISDNTVDGRYTGLSWGDAIERVLREADEPLHVRDIWRRLSSGGFRTDARDPRRSIAAIAVRDPRIAKAAPNTYALVDRRAGYEEVRQDGDAARQ